MDSEDSMKIAIYPGSFDPITLGHLDVIKRSAKIFDKVIIGVLNNSSKSPLFLVEERVKMIQEAVKDMEEVTVESFSGLLVDFAKEKNADVIVRGLRAITDFEYELQTAQLNRNLNQEVDTVFLATSVEYAYLSSSSVREIAAYKGDISSLVPPELIRLVEDRFND